MTALSLTEKLQALGMTDESAQLTQERLTLIRALSDTSQKNIQLREALSKLECAADPFLADQSRAEDPRCGLTQPVSVAECEALNEAVKEARQALKETEGE